MKHRQDARFTMLYKSGRPIPSFRQTRHTQQHAFPVTSALLKIGNCHSSLSPPVGVGVEFITTRDSDTGYTLCIQVTSFITFLNDCTVLTVLTYFNHVHANIWQNNHQVECCFWAEPEEDGTRLVVICHCKNVYVIY